jgi:hypothetical protein
MNFFVGENSTGKTSVLKLIKLFSDFRFWIYTDFNINEIELGYFSEITSNNSGFFEIGFHNENPGKRISAVKLKFIEKNGIPILSNINMVNSSFNIDVSIESKDDGDNCAYSYKYFPLDLRQLDELKNIDFFKYWINDSGFGNSSFESFRKEESVPQQWRYDLSYILYQLLNEINKGEPFGLEEYEMEFFNSEITWLAPIRTEPRRTYDSYKKTFNPDGSHTPYVLKDMIGNGNDVNKVRIEKIINKFGVESGLFEKIEIVAFEKIKTSPFEIRLFLNGNSLKITNVGYGISQILPLITEIISRPKGSWFAIQQPEIHLHPKAQAAFGDFIFSFLGEKKNFIIETHSDYMIDRFRLSINKQHEAPQEDDSAIESQVIFFKRSEDGNELVIIPIQEDGSYPDDQPKEFREFFLKEQIDLLSI